jgi:hypothetical protein
MIASYRRSGGVASKPGGEAINPGGVAKRSYFPGTGTAGGSSGAGLIALTRAGISTDDEPNDPGEFACSDRVPP